MNKILKRATAGLLVIAFGFICIPESLRAVFSDKIQTAKANTAVEREAEIQPDEFAYNSLEKQETYILSENRNMRNRYRKVYNLSDGAVLAEQYSTPVHYFDKAAGKYEEIDNSLIETSDENGTYYKNAANAYGVKIYKNAAQSDSFIEISKDGYKLSFKPVEEKNTLKKFVAGNVQIGNADPISAGLKSEFDYSANRVAETRFVPSSVREAVYNNFADGASLKYALNSSEISEIITINRSAEQYPYVFGLDGDGLFFEEQDDGAVLAYNPEGVEALRIEGRKRLTQTEEKVLRRGWK